MKNVTKLLVVFAFSMMAFAASAQDENGLIGIARGVARECIQNVGNFDISASVETTGICFVSGSLHRVTFVGTPKCSGQEICPLYAILVATVEFDCDNNPTLVYCGGQ